MKPIIRSRKTAAIRKKFKLSLNAEDVQTNLAEVQKNIKASCAKSGLPYSDVRIVVITRGKSIPEVRELVKGGCRNFGENRVQEGLQKKTFFSADIQWHLVGHLQSVKTRTAVQSFSLLHTVDSLRIGYDLQESCEEVGRDVNVLIQVNTTDSDAQFGILPSETLPLIKEFTKFPMIHIRGLMLETPTADTPEMARPWFKRLRELSEKVRNAGIQGVEMKWLSMGDSTNYTIAVEEGANIIRLTRPFYEDE